MPGCCVCATGVSMSTARCDDGRQEREHREERRFSRERRSSTVSVTHGDPEATEPRGTPHPGRRLQLPVQPVAAIAGRALPARRAAFLPADAAPASYFKYKNQKVFILDREDDPVLAYPEPAGGRSGEPGQVTDVRAGVPPEPGRHHPDGSIPGRDSISIITLKGNITQYR